MIPPNRAFRLPVVMEFVEITILKTRSVSAFGVGRNKVIPAQIRLDGSTVLYMATAEKKSSFNVKEDRKRSNTPMCLMAAHSTPKTTRMAAFKLGSPSRCSKNSNPHKRNDKTNCFTKDLAGTFYRIHRRSKQGYIRILSTDYPKIGKYASFPWV